MGDSYIEPDIEKLKRMWLNRTFAGPSERADAEANFDAFIEELMGHAEMHQQEAREAAELVQQVTGRLRPSPQMFMELILEIEQSAALVPSRVAEYRKKLAEAGLDKAPEKKGEMGTSMGGMAGINLADQGALEFHGVLLNLAVNLAQATLEEKASKPANDPRFEEGQ